MFAIVQISGKQYPVTPGQSVVVDHIDGQVGSEVVLDQVLLINSDKGLEVGTPTLKNIVVKTTITEQGKGEKIAVRRFKSKVRYRRHIGFRPHLTKLLVGKIDRA